VEEAEERNRPYICAVGAGCTKRYRQMNGLKVSDLQSRAVLTFSVPLPQLWRARSIWTTNDPERDASTSTLDARPCEQAQTRSVQPQPKRKCQCQPQFCLPTRSDQQHVDCSTWWCAICHPIESRSACHSATKSTWCRSRTPNGYLAQTASQSRRPPGDPIALAKGTRCCALRRRWQRPTRRQRSPGDLVGQSEEVEEVHVGCLLSVPRCCYPLLYYKV
jgi:hypothetical protein